MRWWRDLEVVLSALCGLFLLASIPLETRALVYGSIAFGSVFALKSMAASLRERQIDVNLLMVLAAAGAIFVGQPLDAAILLFLFALSGALESLAMTRTKSAIHALIQLRPTTAWRIPATGDAIQVPVEELALEDRIQIPSFQNIPVDCRVESGRSSVDNSALTGESRPIPVEPGSELYAGTQNQSGSLIATVTATVGDSTLDRIVALVEDAQQNQASGERIANWFGQRYTVLVLLAFSLALLVRLAFLRQPMMEGVYGALTLLVALSPCALVISTPASTLSALAWCARHGLLVRGGRMIEEAGQIQAVALDKTGTITTGKPEVLEVLRWDGGEVTSWTVSDDTPREVTELLEFGASVEQYSPHPMGQAILRLAKRHLVDSPPSEAYEEHPGLGASATVQDRRVTIGQANLLESHGFEIPGPLADAVQSRFAEGQSVAFIGVDGMIAAFVFGDQIRPETQTFLKQLEKLGIQDVRLLTGDHEAPAKAIGEATGIRNVQASLLPGEKVDAIAQLASQKRVMMVGDGVNDGPALARAHLGVALGGLGSDVAMNAAGVVLMNDQLTRIVDLIRIGRRTRRIIRANLLLASGMIVTLTLASLFTRLPLPIAVIGHEGSTVLVILNGLRLLQGPEAQE